MLKFIVPVALFAALSFTSSAMAELIDNSDYHAWSEFKPGSSVTLQMTMTINPKTVNHATLTLKLLEVKPDSVTIEVTSVLSSDGMPTKNSKGTAVIKAKVEKSEQPPGTPADMKGEIRDVKDGKETVEFNGNKIETVTHQETVVSTPSSTAPATSPAHILNGIATTTKTWTSLEIPGGTFKRESSTTPPHSEPITSTLTLVDYTIAK